MKLYYHKTDGGAEYYYTTYVECPNGHKEGGGSLPIIRTDGGEIELFVERMKQQGIRIVLS